MYSMKLYNTESKKYDSPNFTDEVSIYVCGITPYDSAHLGHIFTFMTYDLLARRLEDAGKKVKMVRNITDVDEPMYVKAEELGTDYMSLADTEIKSFDESLSKLRFMPVYAAPRASQYIEQMSKAVERLLATNYAYRLENGDIYFDTKKVADFGSFAGFSENLLLALFKERGGNPDEEGKRNKLDFLLWKQIHDAADSAQWETALGSGRPGWHIECSVMSSALLGDTFAIHGGGSDLIFPHHECEIAQSIALNGVKPALLWLHVYPMLLAGEKMSKSLGNMVFAKDLLETYDGAVIRLALMHYHHRIGGEWQPELLTHAEKLLNQVTEYKAGTSLTVANQLLGDVRTALDDDLNTLEVIDAIQEFIISSENVDDIDRTTESEAIVNQTLSLLGLV